MTTTMLPLLSIDLPTTVSTPDRTGPYRHLREVTCEEARCWRLGEHGPDIVHWLLLPVAIDSTPIRLQPSRTSV